MAMASKKPFATISDVQKAIKNLRTQEAKLLKMIAVAQWTIRNNENDEHWVLVSDINLTGLKRPMRSVSWLVQVGLLMRSAGRRPIRYTIPDFSKTS